MNPRFAYASFMLVAMLVFLLARRCFPASRSGLEALPRRERLYLGLAAFIGGVLGAKLPFVLVAGGDWFGSAWLADGKTITTGLMGAYISVELAKLWLGVKAKTGDSFALPLALSMAVGRWGCFFHGCCFGTPTQLPWGVDFGDGVPRHPTQIYESLFHFAMAFVLIAMLSHGRFRNQRLKLYLIAYGAYRFLTEFIRPEPNYALGLTYFQWVALVAISGLAVQWWYDARQMNAASLAKVRLRPCEHLPAQKTPMSSFRTN